MGAARRRWTSSLLVDEFWLSKTPCAVHGTLAAEFADAKARAGIIARFQWPVPRPHRSQLP
jgi:hypothetical protein